MMNNNDVFLGLVRLGIKHSADRIADSISWNSIQALAEYHGLSAVIVDGLEELPENQRPPRPILLQWIGETLQGYEYRYELYRRTIAELAEFYNLHGFRIMVLKGFACSLNWPRPEHRPCGDIDIWLFGKNREADSLLKKEKGIRVDKSHHHHTVFYWRDFMVENHYDFVNIYAEKSSRELEKIFKELSQDDSFYVELFGEKVYLPSPDLHSSFLIRHMVSHFTSSSITLRQVIDWAFFVEKYSKEINWEWLLALLEKHHMMDFFNCINAICVEDLGFPDRIFKTRQCDPQIKKRVLNDILNPVFTAEEPHGLVKRMIYKFHRWKGNAWKRALCYSESGGSLFWTGIWAKLLKPSSI